MAPLLDSIELWYMVIACLDQCGSLCPSPPLAPSFPIVCPPRSRHQRAPALCEHLRQVPPLLCAQPSVDLIALGDRSCRALWAMKRTRAFTQSDVGAQVSDDGECSSAKVLRQNPA